MSNSTTETPIERTHIAYLTPELLASEEPIWVNPVGGKGDVIMLSTAMMRCYQMHGRRFRLARRADYTQFFQDHPAVELIGHPRPDDLLLCNDYWSRPDFDDPGNRALDILFHIFGVDQWPDRDLYLPPTPADPALDALIANIPWSPRTVVISTSSESPRKMMHPVKWHILVDRLLQQRCTVLQLGGPRDIPIVGAYALMGCTTPRQIVPLLQRAQLVITPDNFIMHAARVAQTPCISLFGPTEASRYAYPEHIPLMADMSHCPHVAQCLGPQHSQNYATPCPLGPEQHCMNTIPEPRILDVAMSILNRQ